MRLAGLIPWAIWWLVSAVRERRAIPSSVPLGISSLSTADLSFLVTLGNIVTSQALATITDNDNPPTITIANTNIAEGSVIGATTLMTFQISLSAASGMQITMNFATANGTALSSSDYTNKTGTVTFAPGETVKIVTVSIKQDTTLEGNETLLLKLSNAVNAVFGNTTGIGTILNDD